MFERGLGCRRDVHDHRDRMFTSVAASMNFPAPDNVSVGRYQEPTRNQRRTNTCCGQAIADVIYLAYRARGIDCPPLSALDPYWRARHLDGEGQDVGTSPRQVLRAVMNDGIAPESEWPFSEAAVDQPPSIAALHAGHERRGIRGYYRLADDVWTQTKIALAEKAPPFGGWAVSDAFCRSDGREVFEPQTWGIAGRHAMGVAACGDPDYIESLLGPWGFRARMAGGEQELAVLDQSWGCLSDKRNPVDYGFNGRIVVRRAFLELGFDLWSAEVFGNDKRPEGK